jgi:hypothetical protein
MSIFQFFSKNNNQIKKIGFEDILHSISLNYSEDYLLINTLLASEQDILIPNTIRYSTEEETINNLIKEGSLYKYNIIVYGKNCCDETVEKKCQQLIKLGFPNVFFYPGGMFEWSLLQDVYSFKNFPTTKPVKDILYFRSSQIIKHKINNSLLTWKL